MMRFPRDYKPDYDSLKTLLLEMAQEHAVAPLLEMIVRQLDRRAHIALARIWLLQEGGCPCPAGTPACDDKAQCLHFLLILTLGANGISFFLKTANTVRPRPRDGQDV